MAKLDRFIIDNTTYELVPEIAPLFDPATPYSVGDCVIHDAVLYKFTANHAAGAWTGNDVEAFEVGNRINKISDSVVPEFNASASYTTGQYAYKNGVLYRFTSDHTGAWTGNDVVNTSVADEIDETKTEIGNLDGRVSTLEDRSSDSNYKTADKNDWVFSLSLSDERITVLQNTRITSLQERTVNGYTTYLVPYSVLSEYGTFTKISGNVVYFLGYYTESGGARTYVNHSDYISMSEAYTGMAVCMSNSNGTLENLVFMYTMNVITKKTSYIELPGFSGYDTDELVAFNATSQSYLWACSIKVDTDKVYAIDLGDYTTVAPWAVKNGTSAFSVISQAKFAKLGKYYVLPSIDGYLTWQMRPNADGNNIKMYNSNGIKVYVLDKPWEVHAVSKTVPCRAYVHAGNFKHQVMLAYALGWRGVETDVRTTSDGEFILSHDATLGGLTIADSTYADILAAYPGVMTVDELIEFSTQFNCSIFYHFQNVNADDRWTIMCRSQQFDIDHLGYSLASAGYIGTETVSTFWKYGYYTWGSATIPDDIAQARYNIGGTYDEDYPQTAYYMQAVENGGTPTNTELSETYKDYFSDLCYLSKYYPIYDAICKNLELDSIALTFAASGTKKLYPTPDPIYCSEDITWASSDESVATVAASSSVNTMFPYATVTAVGNGTCTITATCGNMQATCTVSVLGLS